MLHNTTFRQYLCDTTTQPMQENKRLIPLLDAEGIKQLLKKEYPRAYYHILDIEGKAKQKEFQHELQVIRLKNQIEYLNGEIQSLQRQPIDVKLFSQAVADLPVPYYGRDTFKHVMVATLPPPPRIEITKNVCPPPEKMRDQLIRFTFEYDGEKWIYRP